jgi:origin recognition complex subunit 5
MARVHFHDEALLCPSIISVRPKPAKEPKDTSKPQQPPTTPSKTPSTPKKNKRASSPPWMTHATPSQTPSRATPSAATTPSRTLAGPSSSLSSAPELATLLPRTARLVLLASYLASHNAAKHDVTLFSTHHHGRRRKRGGGTIAPRTRASAGKHRKIARRLLGAQAFVFERMIAIFAAVRSEWIGGSFEDGGGGDGDDDGDGGRGGLGAGDMDADVAMAVATLASLRLLVRVGGANADVLDRAGKWRINIGWDMVRALGRSMGVEMEDWLIE